ncbi:hypothetical protein HY024_01665 [Candidatus Curtissbacteria bacterium]|nr:hypothetical protein [Candidatus Curtissbacteria bacterium]
MGHTPTEARWAEFAPLADPTEFMRTTADLLVRNCTKFLQEGSSHRSIRILKGTGIGKPPERYFLEIPEEGIHWEGFADQDSAPQEFAHPSLDQIDLYDVPIEIPMKGTTKTFQASLLFEPEHIGTNQEIQIEIDGLDEADNMPDFLLRSAIKDHVEKVTAFLKEHPRIPAKPEHIPRPKRDLDIA